MNPKWHNIGKQTPFFTLFNYSNLDPTHCPLSPGHGDGWLVGTDDVFRVSIFQWLDRDGSRQLRHREGSLSLGHCVWCAPSLWGYIIETCDTYCTSHWSESKTHAARLLNWPLKRPLKRPLHLILSSRGHFCNILRWFCLWFKQNRNLLILCIYLSSRREFGSWASALLERRTNLSPIETSFYQIFFFLFYLRLFYLTKYVVMLSCFSVFYLWCL